MIIFYHYMENALPSAEWKILRLSLIYLCTPSYNYSGVFGCWVLELDDFLYFLLGCVTLGRLYHLSVPQFLHL